MDRGFPYPPAVTKSGQSSADDALGTSTASVLAKNVRALMDYHRAELGSNPKLGKKSGLGASAISRLLAGHNATIETLERLAAAFELSPWQLLIPMDPKNPPALKVPTEAEKAFYTKIEEAERALKALKEGA